MSWKHVSLIALAALLAVSACKKKAETKEETPAPTAEPAAAPTEGEGEKPAEGEGEKPAEGETPAEGEGEKPAEGETPAEGEGEAAATDDACAGFVEKMIACAKEAAGGAELPAEAVEQMKTGYVQTCDAWKAAGQAELIGNALEACKDTACGAGGSDYVTCVGTKITEAAMAAAGVAAP